MTEQVTFLSQEFQYIEELGVSGFVRLDLVKSYQPIDGFLNRDFLYNRYTWATAVSGEFEFLREIPLGVATVSGA